MSTSYETASYVGAMDETIPGDSGTNGKRTNGAAEIRKFKDIVKDSFPSVAGVVTSTHTELNYVDVTAGTAAASKAIVANGSAQVNASAITWSDLGTVTTVDLNGGSIASAVTLEDGVAATTQSQGDNSTKLATTAYVDTAIAGGPAFRAYHNTTQSGSGSPTIVAFNTDTGDGFDTDNDYDTTTYKFTPSKEGYYLAGGTIVTQLATGTVNTIYIYKNTSEIASKREVFGSIYASRISVSTLVYMNGSTDTLEIRYADSARTIESGNAGCNFWAAFQRGT